MIGGGGETRQPRLATSVFGGSMAPEGGAGFGKYASSVSSLLLCGSQSYRMSAVLVVKEGSSGYGRHTAIHRPFVRYPQLPTPCVGLSDIPPPRVRSDHNATFALFRLRNRSRSAAFHISADALLIPSGSTRKVQSALRF